MPLRFLSPVVGLDIRKIIINSAHGTDGETNIQRNIMSNLQLSKRFMNLFIYPDITKYEISLLI